MLLNFHVEISFRYYVKTDFGVYYVFVGLDYLVSPRSKSIFRNAIYFDSAKSLFERDVSFHQHL